MFFTVKYAGYVWGYGIAAGALLTFISGIGKTGINTANIGDYLETNARWIKEGSRDDVEAELSALSIIMNKGQIK